jgi:nitroreductase
MDLDEAIRRRRMHRDFSPVPVPPEVVDRLLDRARRAPSAGHTQGWSFLVLETPSSVGSFWTAAADDDWRAAPSLPGLLKAPVVVVPWYSHARYESRYSEPDKASSPALEVPYWLVDVSFSVMLLLLGVVAEGLGALFFRLRPGAEERLREAFGVPPEWSAAGAVAIGQPAEGSAPARRPRKVVDEVVHRGHWAR